jgi:hypothetical protein
MDPIVNASEKRRSFELDNGLKVTASCENDPYGFWRFIWEKGSPPKEIAGQYTTFTEAHKALQGYCNGHKLKIVLVQDNTKTKLEEGRRFEDRYDPPELKTKPQFKTKTVEVTVPLDK